MTTTELTTANAAVAAALKAVTGMEGTALIEVGTATMHRMTPRNL